MGAPKKLTEEQRAAMAEALKEPNANVGEVAKRFGVERTTAYKYLPQERRRHPVDLSGQVFGRWTALHRDVEVYERHKVSRYWCRCACGSERSVLRKELTSGVSKMCRECREKEGVEQG